MQVTELPIAGLKLLEPRVFADDRGYFLETHHGRKLAEQGLRETFVQDNLSFSRRGVLRGLHYQYPNWQGKLVTVVQGEVFDVAVDIRRGSPTFGQWYGILLSEDNHKQLYIPAGFAHGFCVTSETARVLYKCTDFYNPRDEHTLLWNDPDVGVDWPVAAPLLSDKDARGLALKDLALPK